LRHLRPGRMSRRWEENSKNKMLKILSDSSPETNFRLVDKNNQDRMRGANEDDIIFGGLEDIMSNSS